MDERRDELDMAARDSFGPGYTAPDGEITILDREGRPYEASVRRDTDGKRYTLAPPEMFLLYDVTRGTLPHGDGALVGLTAAVTAEVRRAVDDVRTEIAMAKEREGTDEVLALLAHEFRAGLEAGFTRLAKSLDARPVVKQQDDGVLAAVLAVLEKLAAAIERLAAPRRKRFTRNVLDQIDGVVTEPEE